jgi:hypothetical protein
LAEGRQRKISCYNPSFQQESVTLERLQVSKAVYTNKILSRHGALVWAAGDPAARIGGREKGNNQETTPILLGTKQDS